MEKTVPSEKLLEILKPFKDKGGYFERAISFAQTKSEPVTFVGRYEIEISETIKRNQVFWFSTLDVPYPESRIFYQYWL